jgi:quercetin dioxygenase-like cupin family protein
MRVLLVGLLLVLGCAARSPRLPFDAGDLAAFLAAHPRAPGQQIRADEIGRTAGASFHVVQIWGAESPHRHVAHDLAATVLRGEGTLVKSTRRIDLAAGDAAVVPRGEVHWFTRTGSAPAVALVTFVPPLDAPDSVPADVR